MKKLEELKEKKIALQEKEDKIKGEILEELSETLIASQAVEIDFHILVGGILEVIEKAKQGHEQAEVWKLSGQKFCQQHAKSKAQKNNTSAKKTKKNKDLVE